MSMKRVRYLYYPGYDEPSVYSLGEPGDGGMYHEYRCDQNWEEAKHVLNVSFQKGPVKEVGYNGCQIEDLLLICRDRLQCAQDGVFSCRENAAALMKIEEALLWLNHRTADRKARKVEGKVAK